MGNSKVYFTKEITSKKVVDMFKILDKKLRGNVAVKVHSGEKGNQNYLKPEFLKDIIEYVEWAVVETNIAYDGERNTTERHKRLFGDHNWSKLLNVDIMDEEGGLVLEAPNDKILKKNYVGKNITKYDSMLVLSHFKGHPMGGYGGELKQLSIGVSSAKGKRYIHCAGKEDGSYEDMFKVEQNKFLESMADAASSVANYFKGNIVYINIMCNISADYDCCEDAKEPCISDIGILSSLDPVALDKECIGLVYSSNGKEKEHLIERIESRNGTYTIDCAKKLSIGNTEYSLIILD